MQSYLVLDDTFLFSAARHPKYHISVITSWTRLTIGSSRFLLLYKSNFWVDLSIASSFAITFRNPQIHDAPLFTRNSAYLLVFSIDTYEIKVIARWYRLRLRSHFAFSWLKQRYEMKHVWYTFTYASRQRDSYASSRNTMPRPHYQYFVFIRKTNIQKQLNGNAFLLGMCCIEVKTLPQSDHIYFVSLPTQKYFKIENLAISKLLEILINAGEPVKNVKLHSWISLISCEEGPGVCLKFCFWWLYAVCHQSSFLWNLLACVNFSKKYKGIVLWMHLYLIQHKRICKRCQKHTPVFRTRSFHSLHLSIWCFAAG